MITSLLPFQITVAIALIVIALVAFLHGAIDAHLFLAVVTPLFTFAVGVVTDTKVPEDKWRELKKEEMEADELQEGLNQLGAEIAEVPRHPTLGYRGAATFKKIIAMAVFQGADGKLYVADPSEIVDGHPDLALREWITVRGEQAGGRENVKPGSSGGIAVGDLLQILNNVGAGGIAGVGTPRPGRASWLDLLRGALGGSR